MSTKTKEQAGYVYIVANKYAMLMYVGVTLDLESRVSAHKRRFLGSANNETDQSSTQTNAQTCIDDSSQPADRPNSHVFKKGSGADRLVYFEKHESIQKAIQRRRELNNLDRFWMATLIDKHNPDWDDRYQEVI
jgi:putative endonuclease